MDQKKQFLQRKGLTDAEIEEAVKRVPPETAAAPGASSPPQSTAIVAQPQQPYYAQPAPQQQIVSSSGPPQQQQPVRWSHALLGAAFVAAGAYALKVLLWPYVQDALSKWRASQAAEEERAAQQARRTEALAEAIRVQTSELHGTVELLRRLTATLEHSQAEARRADALTLVDLRTELRTLAGSLKQR